MWMNRVVECVGASNLVLKTMRKNNRGQQFFLDDKTQTIVSNQWKDRSITIQSQGRSNNLYMTTTNARWFQLFRWQGNMLVNDKGKVMTIQGDFDQENRNIIVENKNVKIGQTWEIVYADEMPDPPKKGEMNPDWGFKVGVPFHIVSNLGQGRYLDLVGNSPVIKTRNGFPSQGWWFDQRTRTIKSWRTRSYSLAINGNGKRNDLII